jgi:hypothetical protein
VAASLELVDFEQEPLVPFCVGGEVSERFRCVVCCDVDDVRLQKCYHLLNNDDEIHLKIGEAFEEKLVGEQSLCIQSLVHQTESSGRDFLGRTISGMVDLAVHTGRKKFA